MNWKQVLAAFAQQQRANALRKHNRKVVQWHNQKLKEESQRRNRHED